jgi:hypothetical protein
MLVLASCLSTNCQRADPVGGPTELNGCIASRSFQAIGRLAMQLSVWIEDGKGERSEPMTSQLEKRDALPDHLCVSTFLKFMIWWR